MPLNPQPTSAQAQGDITGFYNTRKRPIDYYNRAVDKFGIKDARQTLKQNRQSITDTENLISAVDPSVTGRTQGSLVTDAQRQGLITKEKTPLYEGLQNLAGIYSTSQANLSDLMSQAQMWSQQKLSGDQQRLQALMQRLEDARYREQQARARAASAQDNAWATALAEALGGYGGDNGNSASQGIDPYELWKQQQQFGSARLGSFRDSLGRNVKKMPNKTLITGSLDKPKASGSLSWSSPRKNSLGQIIGTY